VQLGDPLPAHDSAEDRANIASVFGPDLSGGGLGQPTLELVREIEARGLP